jgi:hypothetical protein
MITLGAPFDLGRVRTTRIESVAKTSARVRGFLPPLDLGSGTAAHRQAT